MAIALRGAAAVPTGNPTTSFTVTVPSQVLTDDLLFLTVTSRDSTGAGTLAVTDNDTGGNTWTKIGNSTDHKITLWYKRATSGTASKTVTVSNAVGSSSGVLKAFSGASVAATPYSNIVVESNASGDEAHAGFTPDVADSMVCAAVANYANDNAVTSLSFATLGATTATEKLSTGGSDCGNIFGHALQSGGPTGTGDLTWAQTNGTTYSMTWAIKPQVAYTLTADSGSFSESGAAATPRAARQLAATSGAYTVSGSAAGVRKGYPLAAASGTYSLAGVAAGLAAARKLAAGAGSYAWTGVAASVRAARRLAVGEGVYMLTGSAVTLVHSGGAQPVAGGPSIYVPPLRRRAVAGIDEEDEELALLYGGMGHA